MPSWRASCAPPRSSRGAWCTTLDGACASPFASAPPLWEIAVGPRILSRTFTYTDNLSGLPGYTLSGALALAAEGELYPTASNPASGARNFGFAGYFETSVGAKTSSQSGGSSD